MIEIDGRVQCLSAWGRELGVKVTTALYRLDTKGLTARQAFGLDPYAKSKTGPKSVK